MTLVAAALVNGFPMLVGDVLLTRGGERAGLRKKVLQLRANVALGWSGRLIEAQALLKELDSLLSLTPSVEQLREAIIRVGTGLGARDLALAGWVLSSEHGSASFVWRSDSPGDLLTGTYHAIGSGADMFRYYLPPSARPRERNLQSATLAMLTTTGRLMQSDLTDGLQQKLHQFGVAYDVLIGEGSSFRPVSPVVYTEMSVQLTDSFDVADISSPRGVLLHREVRDHTIFQHRYEGSVDIHLVDPVIEKQLPRVVMHLHRWLERIRTPLLFKGAYAVVFVQFVLADGEHLPPALQICERGTTLWNQPVNSHGVVLGISRQMLSQQARIIAADVNTRRSS